MHQQLFDMYPTNLEVAKTSSFMKRWDAMACPHCPQLNIRCARFEIASFQCWRWLPSVWHIADLKKKQKQVSQSASFRNIIYWHPEIISQPPKIISLPPIIISWSPLIISRPPIICKLVGIPAAFLSRLQGRARVNCNWWRSKHLLMV